MNLRPIVTLAAMLVVLARCNGVPSTTGAGDASEPTQERPSEPSYCLKAFCEPADDVLQTRIWLVLVNEGAETRRCKVDVNHRTISLTHLDGAAGLGVESFGTVHFNPMPHDLLPGHGIAIAVELRDFPENVTATWEAARGLHVEATLPVFDVPTRRMVEVRATPLNVSFSRATAASAEDAR